MKPAFIVELPQLGRFAFVHEEAARLFEQAMQRQLQPMPEPQPRPEAQPPPAPKETPREARP